MNTISCDGKSASDFLQRLCVNEPVTFQCFHDQKASDKPAFILHGSIDEHFDRLQRANQDGYGVFVCVNRTDGRGRKKENITALRALFVDSDNGPLPSEMALQPNIIVESKGGEHAYWFLIDGEPLDKFTEAQTALAKALGTDGSVKDLPRVMRLPGFFHNKSDPYMVTWRLVSEERHTIKHILDAFGVSNPIAPTRTHHRAPDASTIAHKRFEAYLIKAGSCTEGGRNTTAHMLAKKAGDFGLSSSDTFAHIRAWNCKNNPPLDERELQACVDSAYQYRDTPIGSDPPRQRASDDATRAAIKQRVSAGDIRSVVEHLDAYPLDERELLETVEQTDRGKEFKAARKQFFDEKLKHKIEETNLPRGYVIDDRGVVYLAATDDGIKETVVTPTKLTILTRYRIVESGEEYLELSFGRSKKVVIKSVVFDTRKIVSLSAFGLSVTSINSRLVVQYLQALDEHIKESCPTINVVEKLGDHGPLGWKLGNHTIGGNGEAVEYWHDRAIPGEHKLDLGVSGSVEMYRKIITGLDAHPKALLCFYAACASPLLSIIGCPGFVVDIHGKTSRGKTSAMRIASSVFGSPSMIQKWNTTETYRERWAAFHNHIPIFLDDHKDRGGNLRFGSDIEHPITAAIYQLSDGIGRGRGTVTGIQSLRRWHLVTFSTGEGSLLDYDNSEGSLVRCLSLDDKIINDASDTWMQRLFLLEKHHGFVGRALIELLASSDRAKLTDEHERLTAYFATQIASRARNMVLSVIDRISRRFAAIQHAARLTHEAFDLPWPYDPLGLEETLLSTVWATQSGDRSLDALCAIYDVCVSRASCFVGHADFSETKDTVGMWSDPNDRYGTIYLIPSMFKQTCKLLGFDSKVLLRDFRRNGWLERDSTGEHPRVMIRGARIRCYGLRFAHAGVSRDTLSLLDGSDGKR